MSYANGEKLILRRVLAVNGFNNNNIARSDWKILNSGESKQYAIVRPGDYNEGPASLGGGASGTRTVQAEYTTIVELWRKFDELATPVKDLQDIRDDVVDELNKYPRLGDATNTIVDANVSGSGDFLEKWTGEGGPRWVAVDLSVSWIEHKTVTNSE